MIVSEARVALRHMNQQISGRHTIRGCSLFRAVDDLDVGPPKLFAKDIGESGSRLWNGIANDEAKVVGVGHSFRK